MAGFDESRPIFLQLAEMLEGKIIAVITIPSRRPQVGTIRPGTFRYEPTGARGSAETINESGQDGADAGELLSAFCVP